MGNLRGEENSMEKKGNFNNENQNDLSDALGQTGTNISNGTEIDAKKQAALLSSLERNDKNQSKLNKINQNISAEKIKEFADMTCLPHSVAQQALSLSSGDMPTAYKYLLEEL